MKDAKELKLMTTDDAVAQIQDNMILGIGTGSTIELLIPKIAERIQQDNLNVTGVCTSNKSEFLAKQYNINVVDINDITYINLAIDGAETAQVLAQISQAIVREDAIVTHDLHDIFPFWKEGWPMVQFDNAYKIALLV